MTHVREEDLISVAEILSLVPAKVTREYDRAELESWCYEAIAELPRHMRSISALINLAVDARGVVDVPDDASVDRVYRVTMGEAGVSFRTWGECGCPDSLRVDECGDLIVPDYPADANGGTATVKMVWDLRVGSELAVFREPSDFKDMVRAYVLWRVAQDEALVDIRKLGVEEQRRVAYKRIKSLAISRRRQIRALLPPSPSSATNLERESRGLGFRQTS